MVDTVATVVAGVQTEVKTLETKIFNWIQAHYTHALAAVVGWFVSHYSVISAIFAKL
jgi:hypothetical protein